MIVIAEALFGRIDVLAMRTKPCGVVLKEADRQA